jgi:hypothetical protein
MSVQYFFFNLVLRHVARRMRERRAERGCFASYRGTRDLNAIQWPETAGVAARQAHSLSRHLTKSAEFGSNNIIGPASIILPKLRPPRSLSLAPKQHFVPGLRGPVAVETLNLGRFNAQQQAAAKLILSRFAAAGLGRIQQITAVANAWKESSLNPSARTQTAREGLFQLNMRKGLGVGHSVTKLQDPAKNTDIIIGVCKRVPEFVSAQTLDDVVAAFVHFFEKPANQSAEIANRLQKAKSLMA